KAWLCIAGVTYARTHSLRYLITLLEHEGEDVSELRRFENLSMFAVQFRYDSYNELHEAMDRRNLIDGCAELWSNVDALFRALKSPE
ncbi:MAG: HEPN domain-containing protein, partial [Candidatus Hydrogenedentota bacterium]